MYSSISSLQIIVLGKSDAYYARTDVHYIILSFATLDVTRVVIYIEASGFYLLTLETAAYLNGFVIFPSIKLFLYVSQFFNISINYY